MSCGLGTCVDPTCRLCTVVAKLPQPKTLLDHQGKYAVPNPALKKDAKHPSQKKSHRKPLEAPPLRARRES